MRGIYLSLEDGSDGFRLPHNPETIAVKGKGNGEGFKIAKLGSVNILQDEDLQEYQIESFFPTQDYHFLVTEFREPSYYIDKINKWKKEKKVLRYMYVDGSFVINELVSIEQFVYDEKFGSEDVNFTLDLKKYVPFGPKKMELVKKPATGTSSTSTSTSTSTSAAAKTAVKKTSPKRADTKKVPQTYSLIKGDSLWKVAQKYLGNGNRFPEIAKLNGIKASDYRKLPIGLKVKLPAK